MNMTIDPIWSTDANVFEDKHLKAVDAINRNRMTTMPTAVTIHMVLIFILTLLLLTMRYKQGERLKPVVSFLPRNLMMIPKNTRE